MQKNKLVGLREFQRELTKNLPRKGETVVLTRHGKPVASVNYLSTSTQPEASTIVDDFKNDKDG